MRPRRFNTSARSHLPSQFGVLAQRLALYTGRDCERIERLRRRRAQGSATPASLGSICPVLQETVPANAAAETLAAPRRNCRRFTLNGQLTPDAIARSRPPYAAGWFPSEGNRGKSTPRFNESCHWGSIAVLLELLPQEWVIYGKSQACLTTL
jgi:hypothetical protein